MGANYVQIYAALMQLKGWMIKMGTTNILIVGVGGQGTLLTSRIIGNLAMDLGYDVKLSEVHGMAQRGGSVVTHVRFGDIVYSPLIEIGKADIIIAFEKLEALRYIHYLSDTGVIIVNNQRIDPLPVILGSAEYPSDIIDKIKESSARSIVVDALDMARDLGNDKVLNTILLGILARQLDMPMEKWLNAVEKNVPPKTVDINKNAFLKGYNQ